MLWCSDPFIEILKAYGYNIVRLPKEDLKPLQILIKTGGDFTLLGDLATVMVPGDTIKMPLIGPDKLSPTITGTQTNNFSFGIGLSILGTIIGAMGGSKLGLDAKYQGAKKISFEFRGVLENSIAIADLDQFLGEADVNQSSIHVATLLEADQVYVTTSTIKSNTFIVEAKKADGSSLNVDVPIIQEVVGGNVKVAADAQTTSKVMYEGPAPLVFGFQAVQLFYENGYYTAFKPLTTKGAEFVPESGTQALMTDSPLFNLKG